MVFHRLPSNCGTGATLGDAAGHLPKDGAACGTRGVARTARRIAVRADAVRDPRTGEGQPLSARGRCAGR